MAGCDAARAALEFYGDDAVIRSVVVDPAARGLGLGLDIGRLLEEDALASGARDVVPRSRCTRAEFWQARSATSTSRSTSGPTHVRENWQYQFVAGCPGRRHATCIG